MICNEVLQFKFLRPAEKLAIIRARKQVLQEKAWRIGLPFSIITTGSVEYGFNSQKSGNLDDVDCLAILPNELPYEELVNCLKNNNSGRGCFDEVITPTAKDYLIFERDEIQILRMGGSLGGIDISLHGMKLKSLLIAISEVNYKMKTLLPNKRKYYDQIYWQGLLGYSSFMAPSIEFETYKNNSSRIILSEYIFRNYRPFKNEPMLIRSQGGDRVDSAENYFVNTKHDIWPGEIKNWKLKGVVGDKLLQGDIIYSAPGVPLYQILDQLWFRFIALSIKQNPNLTNYDIIYSFSRSSCFSGEFIETMGKKIKNYRKAIEVN